MRYAWFLIFLIALTLGNVANVSPAMAHMGYENTEARNCCSADGKECRMADSYEETNAGFVFIAPWNPNDPSSERVRIEVPLASVKFIDLFPDDPARRGKSHVCATVDRVPYGDRITGHCGFIPPAKNITDNGTFLDASLRRPVSGAFAFIAPS